jgi:endonuclease YncB( thermonuclease family)
MDRVYPNAYVVRVIDGDTVVLDVDLGYNTWRREESYRLAGCNARERTMPGGPEARAHLASLLAPGVQVSLTSVKPDKFGGRYDAYITLPGGQDLTQLLIAQQWAAAWDGKGAKPVPPWPRTLGS